MPRKNMHTKQHATTKIISNKKTMHTAADENENLNKHTKRSESVHAEVDISVVETDR